MKKLCRCGGEIKEYEMLFECLECKAKVWKYSYSKEIKEKDAIALIQGKSILLKGLKSSNGTFYNTMARLENGQLSLIFDEQTSPTSLGRCQCGGDINKIPKGYKCNSCQKVVWEKLVNRELKLPQVKKLFKGESLKLKNLRSKQGNIFNAEVFLEDDELQLEYIA